MTEQIVTHAQLIEALKAMTERFRRCAIHAGSDPEFVDGAVESARDLIARAEAMYRAKPAHPDAAFDALLTEIGLRPQHPLPAELAAVADLQKEGRG